jgi:hypothetical protein
MNPHTMRRTKSPPSTAQDTQYTCSPKAMIFTILDKLNQDIHAINSVGLSPTVLNKRKQQLKTYFPISI